MISSCAFIILWVYFLVWRNTPGSLSLQLFRRVAAALPGMDNTQDKSREDSILCAHVSVCVWHDRKESRGLLSLVCCVIWIVPARGKIYCNSVTASCCCLTHVSFRCILPVVEHTVLQLTDYFTVGIIINKYSPPLGVVRLDSHQFDSDCR